jgi:branched-chain amino acid transport system permease protein
LTALLIQLLTGLAGASSLFLVAAGLTVIFGVTRVVNFSHGSLFMLGAYIGWTILSRLPRDPQYFALGVLLTGLATSAIGALIEMSLLRRIYKAPELLQLLATFGVVLILQDVTQWIWGPADLTLPRGPWLRSSVMILGERFPLYDLILIATGPLILGALWLLFTRTRWGTLVRAATLDREMVSALGVDQRLLFTSVFALGAGLAGIGGALVLPQGSANLQMDLSVITDAFVVVVVGGLGSLAGAYLAAVLIGVLQALGIVLLPKATLVVVFVVMACVLIVRPNGLLGKPLTATRGDAASIAPIRPASPALLCAGAALLIAAIAAPFVVSPFVLSVLTEIAIAILFASSLHVLMGPGGMASFGHAAWFGLGAYGAALAVKSFAVPMSIGLLIAPFAAGTVALAFGALVVRLSGIYLAMLTLAFAQIVWAVAFQWSDVTGGDNGILGVWPPAWAGPFPFYWISLTLCIGATLLLRRALFAPFGFALRASRDSSLRAEAIGLNPRILHLAAFTLAGTAAGLAGGLAAYSKGSVFPTTISIGHSIDALVMVLLGGVQTMAGPIIGAIAYTGLFDALLLATDLWRAALGASILAIVLIFPAGIAGSLKGIDIAGSLRRNA